MPGEFCNLDKYAQNKAWYSKDLISTWFGFSPLKKYDKLLTIVNVNGNTFADRQEAIDVMKRRTQRRIG